MGALLLEPWLASWRADPGRAVLVSGRDADPRVLTRGELLAGSARAAGRLAALGVRAGDRVVLSAEPGIELVVAYVAALRLGAVVVPTNTAYTTAELRHVVADARPVVALGDAAGRFATFAGLLQVGIDALVDPSHGWPTHDRPELDGAAAGDLAWLCYTSGTTGRPKGARHTHASLGAGARAVVDAWAWTPADRLLLALPLFHMHGLGVGVHGTLTAGASAVILDRFDPSAVLAAPEDHGATLFFGVPTMYARLASSRGVSALACYRLCVSGSAPLPADLWARLRDLAGVEILERYGMTETGMLTSNPLDGPRRPGSVGRPFPGVEVRLVGGGDVGEVEVRGPALFDGYWERPEATASAWTPDGWFRTGDVGRWADDGTLELVGRSSELVITGGFNVYPREVEDALREHAEVSDAALVGVPDPEWGERLVAFVVASDPTAPPDPARLEGFLGDRVARFKHPRVWYVVPDLPRNAMGKVDRSSLVRLATGSEPPAVPG